MMTAPCKYVPKSVSCAVLDLVLRCLMQLSLTCLFGLLDLIFALQLQEVRVQSERSPVTKAFIPSVSRKENAECVLKDESLEAQPTEGITPSLVLNPSFTLQFDMKGLLERRKQKFSLLHSSFDVHTQTKARFVELCIRINSCSLFLFLSVL